MITLTCILLGVLAMWTVPSATVNGGITCDDGYECVHNDLCVRESRTRGRDLLKKRAQECITVRGLRGNCCAGGVEPILGASDRCGIGNSETSDSNIAIGKTTFGEFPWQAIIFLNNLTFQCGGALVSQRHVLTLAHCVNFLKPNDIEVRLGEWQIKSLNEFLPYIDRNVKFIHVHEKYVSDGSQRNNIALLELSESVQFDYHINTVCLPKHGKLFSGDCVASGWGQNDFNGQYQNKLKKISLSLVGRRECRKALRQTSLGAYFRLHPSFVCAGGQGSQDTCTGDGGGPLVCRDPTSRQYYLLGLVNSGVKCGLKGVPGLYTNVAYFHGWIQSKIEQAGSTFNKSESFSIKGSAI